MEANLHVLLYLTLLSATLALIPPLTYRSMLVLTGKKPANSFPRSGHDGPAWYKRVMDAHANSLENLVLYGSLVVVCHFSGNLDALNAVCWYYLLARLVQTGIHLISTTHWPVFLRFNAWIIQMGLLVYVMVDLLMA